LAELRAIVDLECGCDRGDRSIRATLVSVERHSSAANRITIIEGEGGGGGPLEQPCSRLVGIVVELLSN